MLLAVAQPGAIADIGAGDGATIHALQRAGLLGDSVYAVDLAEPRVRNAERTAPGVVGIVADAATTGLPDASVDGVVCTQVIEHVADDRAVVEEIARILRPGGWWYISSVMKKKWAWWLYRVDGERRLDPTHVREYATLDEFVNVLSVPDLDVTNVGTRRCWYPVGELVARALSRRRPYPLPRWIAIPPPGFREVEAAGRRATAAVADPRRPPLS